ncbi:MAG: hypothetical protein HY587_05025 [Candidatus Omnitrophica bacterium]|nr:hypothetical protein [Candidatus Omnitrophota bacterium]
MTNRIGLAFIWHMHQPYYRDPESGKALLPWVRLHATKGYWDMLQVLKEIPEARVTFNFTPVLLLQIQELLKDPSSDYFRALTAKRTADLTEEERIFILKHFFMGNWDTLIRPIPRYYLLLQKRGFQVQPRALKELALHFSDQEMRDIQVFFNLIWCGFILREKDETVRALLSKGGNYSEEDKSALLERQEHVLARFISEYRTAEESGQIELTTTPFYHPILPLLYRADFGQGIGIEEDARSQLVSAAQFHEAQFGRKPGGLWPSEGSVSQQILPLVRDAGFKWLATDEGLLYKSSAGRMSKEDVYYPYLVNDGKGRNLTAIFRDRELADHIGFVYSRHRAKDAVWDFIAKLDGIANMLRGKPDRALVTVVLDGENPWESYSDGGAEFLRTLYRNLTKLPSYEMVRVSDFLNSQPIKRKINHLASGSWINSNFDIWGKGEEEEQAWRTLAETRKELAADAPREVWQAMYAAEGSDWFWWYGDDFFSTTKDVFDQLFRANLAAVYKRQGKEPPTELAVPIRRTHRAVVLEPTAFISPVLDGRVTSYFEWKGAACYVPGGFGGSMFERASVIRKICYGFDLKHLYLFVAWDRESEELKHDDAVILFKFPSDEEITLEIIPLKQKTYIYRKKNGAGVDRQEVLTQAINHLAEIAVEFKVLGYEAGDKVEFLTEVRKGQFVIERWPKGHFFNFKVPTDQFVYEQWLI